MIAISTSAPVEQSELCFGPYRLLCVDRRLLCEGKPVQIGGRTLDLLIALARRSGSVVSHTELMSQVWPTAVVEETSLRFHISCLRKALRDGQEGRRYIANISGRGYSFVAPVQVDLRADRGHTELSTQSGSLHMSKLLELPSRLTPVFGREGDISAIRSMLRQRRLVTLLGPGGIGKTTAAVEVARSSAYDYANGVCMVDLSTQTDPEHAPIALATAIGLDDTSDLSSSEVLSTCCQRLGDSEVLLVVDSCEHLIDAVAAIVECLLKAAPRICVLTTSREALACEGEWVYRMEPLAVAPIEDKWHLDQAVEYPALQLFVERSSASVHSFALSEKSLPDVVTLCNFLEGNPLAIELTAGRIASLGLKGQVTRLDELPLLLSRGRRTAQRRHSSLQESFDWSYYLLDMPERIVLQRLSVMQGVFDLRTAVAVAGLKGAAVSAASSIEDYDVVNSVMSLTAKCLLVSDTSEGRASFRLPNVTRRFAADKLEEAAESSLVKRKHALHLRSRLDNLLTTGASGISQSDIEGLRSDINAAIAWASSLQGDTLLASTLSAAFDSLLAGQFRPGGPEYTVPAQHWPNRLQRSLESDEDSKTSDLLSPVATVG